MLAQMETEVKKRSVTTSAMEKEQYSQPHSGMHYQAPAGAGAPAYPHQGQPHY